MKFEELWLDENIVKAIDEHGFSELTKVQEKALPVALSECDIMVQSKTGSGKTLVYLLAILERFAKDESKKALVLAPTRELALQIYSDAKSFSKYMDSFFSTCVYGGVGYEKQERDLKKNPALIVGTPGRLLDFLKSGKIDFKSFDTVVLDEADRMFDMGFYDDIMKIFSRMKNKEERVTMLLSATLNTKVRNLAWSHMNEPVELDVEPEEITVKNIRQELFHVSREEKFKIMLEILKKINPKSAIIFTNTKEKAIEVAKRLSLNDYKAEALIGSMSQSARLKALDDLKKGIITMLVATDVASRGLQIDDLELVVNYDIPEDYENYVHRIGRTARAGKSGVAITLACPDYVYGLEAIESYIQMKIPVLWTDEIGLEEVEDKSASWRYRRERSDKSKSKVQRKKYTGRERKATKSSSYSYKKKAVLKDKDKARDGKKKIVIQHSENARKINLNEIAEPKKSFFARIKSMFKGKKK
ncbi:MAG TPA: DEAD/DEAH box helicase [Candidatus Ornithospirochaeta avicola]|uniref:DEAD/DEAH box helicase n=1 Tax=Candidatus Ornithospirochaeta avicola TaxID=2840896 RepID=A0A9D1TMU4_9SPIO|nr:DEAD/DEAH box helicase [Candidatus Ornithospirochaeta avicola]